MGCCCWKQKINDRLENIERQLKFLIGVADPVGSVSLIFVKESDMGLTAFYKAKLPKRTDPTAEDQKDIVSSQLTLIVNGVESPTVISTPVDSDFTGEIELTKGDMVGTSTRWLDDDGKLSDTPIVSAAVLIQDELNPPTPEGDTGLVFVREGA
jgi:hypothetical protein